MEDMNLLTNENWGSTREALLEGLPANKRAIVSTALDTQKNVILSETAASGSIVSSDIAGYRSTLLPMVRRIIPGTIATEIVGVQPMKTSVAQVFSMRYRYAEAVTHDPSRSVFGGNDIAAGDEAFGNAKALRHFYAGAIVGDLDGAGPGTDIGQLAQAAGASAAGQANIAAATANGEAWGSTVNSTTRVVTSTLYGNVVDGSLRGGHGSHIEGSGGRKMTLEVVGQAVEAQTRKLQATWTIEAMQDMKALHGMDIQNEIVTGLSAEIVQEIDAEILNDLAALAGTVRSYDGTVAGSTGYTPTFMGDRFANLGGVVNEVANVIARKTRRGAANFIVVSPMIVSVLQTAAKSVFAPAVEGSFKGPNNTYLAGTLNGSIKVYCYIWNQADPTVSSGADKIIVGYKGGNGETDTGYWYCPYIPLQQSGVVTNPFTYQPGISLMTRYGKAVLTNTASSLGNSADYYGRINVSGVEFA